VDLNTVRLERALAAYMRELEAKALNASSMDELTRLQGMRAGAQDFERRLRGG
jgi:hypothetical protein